MGKMFPDDKCPYCGAGGDTLTLKATEFEFRRYKCDHCHHYFQITDYGDGTRETFPLGQNGEGERCLQCGDFLTYQEDQYGNLAIFQCIKCNVKFQVDLCTGNKQLVVRKEDGAVQSE